MWAAAEAEPAATGSASHLHKHSHTKLMLVELLGACTSVAIHRAVDIFIWQLILVPGQHILFTSTWPVSTFTTV